MPFEQRHPSVVLHVLHRLLPRPKTIERNLRQRTHNLTLLMDVNATMKQNCVYRMLFRERCFYVLFSLVHFPQTIQIISHLLFRCCMCVCHMLLKYYLLNYLVCAWSHWVDQLWSAASANRKYNIFNQVQDDSQSCEATIWLFDCNSPPPPDPFFLFHPPEFLFLTGFVL